MRSHILIYRLGAASVDPFMRNLDIDIAVYIPLAKDNKKCYLQHKFKHENGSR